MIKKYDDGNWNWAYECEYMIDTYDPEDYYYTISFSIKNGGYLSGGEITCLYYQTKNLLKIYRNDTSIEFYVNNFYDINPILKSMIKANEAVPYPIYVSNNSIRKEKLNNLDKLL